ncbi:MAG: MetQ/NlpA family ABC transporter substrate-binding protein [Micrococcaceae bacterium]
MFSKKFKSIVIAFILTITAAFTVTACGSKSSSRTDGKVIKIGTTEASQDYWKPFQEAAKKRGITIEPVSFSDYTQPNQALDQNQVDLNLFQHIAFLADYNVKNNKNLTPIGSTYVVPLSLYSTKYKKPSEIPENGKVAIPNDPTNQARALLVLQKAGLIKLKDGGNILSTPADITSKKITVQTVDAAQTAANLKSVDAAAINNNFASDANLDQNTVIFKDDPNSDEAKPYVNVIVSRPEDKDNKDYQKVVEAYHDPEVQKAVAAQSKNTSVEVKSKQSDLQDTLKKQEDVVKQASSK